MNVLPPLVDLEQLNWPSGRSAAAAAVAEPNQQRIAQAALERLTLDDHPATFGTWCDVRARADRSQAPHAVEPST